MPTLIAAVRFTVEVTKAWALTRVEGWVGKNNFSRVPLATREMWRVDMRMRYSKQCTIPRA